MSALLGRQHDDPSECSQVEGKLGDRHGSHRPSRIARRSPPSGRLRGQAKKYISAGSQKARWYQMDLRGLARPAHEGRPLYEMWTQARMPRELGRNKLSRKNGEVRPSQSVVLGVYVLVFIG